jgi:two-component system phosphate regulon sensor histidine kinase PhoR
LLFAPKNPTPQKLAAITAANIALQLAVLLLMTKLLLPHSLHWALVAAVPAVVFSIGHSAVSEALARFIYRKIKLIYKSIHKQKATGPYSSSKVDLRTHMIDEVERDVREWATDRSAEIENLKKMEAYRRDFIGNVSHELKTPIFNIQGYLYTLLDGGLDDEKIRVAYLEKAADNVDRLEQIVEDLTTIAKLEEGALQLKWEKFNVAELAQEVLEDLSMMAAEHGVRLGLKEEQAKSFSVRADRERIRQVLTNLVTNSIKYGQPNGRTLIGFYDLETDILVEVSDDGHGIAPEHLPRLFERFYRVDYGRSRDTGGTGLGLSIVKHILEAHHQTIHVRSTVGVGSTFGFTLEKG